MRLQTILIWIILVIGLQLSAQKKHRLQTIAFYNVENLFDTINNTTKKDELSPMMEIKTNKKHIYLDKLSRLSQVLTEIGNKQNKNPPAVIGIAEVENDTVIRDLINTEPLKNFDYRYIHHESPDQRGIDVALLYRKSEFKVLHHQVINPQIYKDQYRVDTRDILWVQGFLNGDKINLIVNHWPSRRGGQKKSNHLREQAAKANIKLIESIRTENPEAKMIIMGDFNDNPNNTSFKNILKTVRKRRKVKKEDLYNPFEQMFRDGLNTLTYKSDIFLFDQILFNHQFIHQPTENKGFKFYKAGIYNPSYMTLNSGKYKGSPKRSFSGSNYSYGYSDHYPVYVYLIQEMNSK